MTQVLEAYVGLQWGDEGKGKIVDERVVYAQSLGDGKKVVVVRYQGGANAGHSVYVRTSSGELRKFVTHSAPSGLTSNADIAIGPHVAFNPLKFVAEVDEARRVFGYSGRILISERVGVLMDYHQKIDAWREGQQDGQGIGSTKQGIGPFYEDNARRTTRITFSEYLSNDFPHKLKRVLELKKRELEEVDALYDNYTEWLVAEHEQARKALHPFAERLEYRLTEYLEEGNHIIIEGAQGTGLDVDMGTIPEQTASHLLAPHAFPTIGLPRSVFTIYGVEKIYPTRVGKGHFPTLACDAFGDYVTENAGEFGATTGRKRRAGYPDWVFVYRAARINDCDEIYIMRADNVQDQDLKVCIAYQLPDGTLSTEVPLILEGVQPVYSPRTYRWHLFDGPSNLSKPETVDEQLKSLRKKYVDAGFSSLPGDLQQFVRDHEHFVGIPVAGISIGPSRGETVMIQMNRD